MKKIDYSDIKSVDTAYLRSNWSKVTKTIDKTETPIIVRKRNADKYVIMKIDDFEDYLDSVNPKLKKDIKKSRGEYKNGKFLSLEETMKKFSI